MRRFTNGRGEGMPGDRYAGSNLTSWTYRDATPRTAVVTASGPSSRATPAIQDGPVTVWQGDALDVLRMLPDESVHCVVTSPPYWGLRDYGAAGQLGLEPTPEEYIANLVHLFGEVRRVLRSEGTLWLNMGDCYNAYNGGAGPSSALSQAASEQRPNLPSGYGLRSKGLKPKDLVGMPWRLALALQADGWWLRSDIIWAKPNPMPESVTDRPTNAHEHVFLLTRSRGYYYDQEPVREAHCRARWMEEWRTLARERGLSKGWNGDRRDGGAAAISHTVAGRNLRNVWDIPTEPYPDAHFATFPSEIPLRAIKAGTSEHGVCASCGAPWRRVVETHRNGRDWNANNRAGGDRLAVGQSASEGMPDDYRAPTTLGWLPTCAHEAPPVPATVLDPFAGSGTPRWPSPVDSGAAPSASSSTRNTSI